VRVATIGASGFIGSNVMRFGLDRGVDMVTVEGPRLTAQGDELGDEFIRNWAQHHRKEFERLVEALAGVDVVINAAGLAQPGCRDLRKLRAVNTVLPAVIASACRQASVRRLVHISTAAVQGRLDPLDESPRQSPFTPYSRSKADAERWLFDTDDAPGELVVYRATSVQGGDRHTTRQLARVAAAPFAPICGDGSQPLPVALVENVAAGVVFSATSPAVVPIILQPWEGLTTRRLLELFGSRRLVSLPESPIRWGLRMLHKPTSLLPRLSASMRTVELLLQGQRIEASSLGAAGFVAPAGEAGWCALVADIREPVADAPEIIRRSVTGQ
jgi:nucleoside-diphosphate-sugar epimerase